MKKSIFTVMLIAILTAVLVVLILKAFGIQNTGAIAGGIAGGVAGAVAAQSIKKK